MLYLQTTQQPEEPINEDWTWLTDVQTSFNGTEDRTPLNRYPRRVFSGTYEFDTEATLRRQLALMQSRFDAIFRFPLFQYKVKLKAPIAAGFGAVTVNAARSDFRVGETAFIFEDDLWEEHVVADVDETSVTFESVVVNDFSARAHVCPVAVVFSDNNASVMRRNPDHSAMSSFRYIEREPWRPFVSPLNGTVLATLGGLPILEQRPTGEGFEQVLATGMQVVDYVGLQDLVAPWLQAQWTFPLSWQVNRVFDNDAWLWWKKFADTLQGSNGEFLLPTFRADLDFQGLALDPGDPDSNSQVVIAGTDYIDHYWPLATFKQIFIESAGGLHYATVTAVNEHEGHYHLVFDPPHPDLPEWYDISKVGFLLRARLADDKIGCSHRGLHTDVSASIRTVS